MLSRVEPKVKITYKSGHIYEGDPCIHGNLNGKGRYTKPNEVIYEGVWKNNKLLHGTITKANLIMNGEFQDYQLHGKGKKTETSASTTMGATTISEGNFQHNYLHGVGKWIRTVGKTRIICEGTFINDHLCGNGKYEKITDDAQLSYTGGFLNNKFYGTGVYKKTNNDDDNTITYEGEFLNGMFHGKGKRTSTINGVVKVQEGVFVNDKFADADDDDTDDDDIDGDELADLDELTINNSDKIDTDTSSQNNSVSSSVIDHGIGG